MGRIILSIVVGFIIWAILWLGSDMLLAIIFSDWYGVERNAYFEALKNDSPFILSSTILIISLIRGAVFCIIVGFISATISNEHSKSALFLGILLLLVGFYAHSYSLYYFPFWYHLLFLGMLIPMTVLGGKLKKI